jgi:hypothetical protein
MKEIKILLIILLFLSGKLPAQEIPSIKKEIDLQQFIEQLFPVQDDDIPYEDFYETLFLYLSQPLDLNKATAEELKSLFILTDPQIQSFFRHLERNGKLFSLYELQAIPGWDLQTIDRLLPFVSIRTTALNEDHRPLLQRIRESGKGMFLQRYERVLEKRSGYLPRSDSLSPAYLGSPDRLYTRFRLNRAHDFSFGFTLDKDAGEAIAWKPAQSLYGADFLSFHAMLYNKGRFRKLVLGDFQLQYGQSLVFGSGFNIGKGAETISTIRRSNTGLRPYSSVLESGFFRGAGLSYRLSPTVEVTSFYSNAPRDARLQENTDSTAAPFSLFSSLQQSGLHRTEQELMAKHSIREQSVGNIVHYRNKNSRLQLGATSLFTQFNHYWHRSPQLYNQFEFSGQRNFAGSIFGEFSWQNVNFFTEAAHSLSGGNALVAGILMALSSQLDISFLARHYERNFHSFYGTAFAEGSRPINEQGLYWGLKYKPLQQLFLTAYYDYFKFPWLRYRVDAPSEGYEYLIRANYQPSRQLLLYAQYREELKDLNMLENPPLRIPHPGTKKNYLIHLDYTPSTEISLRSRVQWSSYHFAGSHSRGYTLVQDLSWQRNRFRISGRIALFDTEDYMNRQYVYEKDVLWAFSIPAYYGRGVRHYLLAQYKLNRHFTIWVRWARTTYVDREHISSGNEKIEGSGINQIKTQIRWSF